jgi:threonine dehydrogenase-like Zn-dependent dehydrogenase
VGDAVLKRDQDPGYADALYFTAPEKVELRPVPVEARSGDIIVSSIMMGISHGTEMLMYRGEFPEGLPTDETLETLGGKLGYPLKYGYINVGTTEKHETVFCFYPHQNRFSVRPEHCVFLPDDIAPRDAVFLASMETAVGLIQDAHPRFGETILIIGQGVIGLLCAAILTRFHHGTIITVDKYAKRREASEALGCISIDPVSGAAHPQKKTSKEIPACREENSIDPETSGVHTNTEIRERIITLAEGRGIDTAINVSSSPTGLQLAIDTLAVEGTLIEASWYGSKKAELELGGSFHRKRLTMRSSQVSTIDPGLSPRWDKKRRLSVVLDCLRLFHPARYITHEFKMQDAHEAYSLIAEHPEETIQVVLIP